MKVALTVDRFDPAAGGLERWTAGLARFLAARGHAVHVVAFEQAPHDLPVRVHLLPPARDVAARARHIAAALVALAPDVAHDTGSGWSADVFHPQTGSRLLAQQRLVATHPPLHRLRAAVSPVSIWRRRQMRFVERRQVGAARRVVAVSRLVRQELVRLYGTTESRFTVVHNGTDVMRFAEPVLAPLRAAMRAEIGAGNAVLFAASAHNPHLKGVDTALRALAILVAEGADVRLAVAGTSADAEWQGLAARLGVADRVSFLGSVGRMERVYAAADALVHPTRWDACSLSTIEAGAAGLPVVTTAMNGAAELISEAETGFVLNDPEDTGGLAARMRMLLDPGLRTRMGGAARARAAAHDVRDNFAAIESLLLEVARARQSNSG